MNRHGELYLLLCILVDRMSFLKRETGFREAVRIYLNKRRSP